MNSTKNLQFKELATGDVASFEVVLTEKMMQQFAALSGDYNPLHVDETYAVATDFHGRVVYGMLGASFFSQLIGMHLPGKQSVYLSQTLFFRAPMRIGMQIVIKGEIVQKVDALQVVVLRTVIFEKDTEIYFVEGEARVKLLA